MAGRLEGKVALISGGARGQGATEALRFAREGARVVIGDVREGDLRDTADAVNAEVPGSVVATPLDVTDLAQWQAAVSLAEREFGGLHVLVNNAGVTGEGFGGLQPIEEMSLEAWEGVLRINLTGAFLGIKAAAPLIRRSVAPLRSRNPRAGGSIVNISSAQGKRPSAFQSNYAASKWALRGLTRVAASELAPEIRVNAVLPGPIVTPMIKPMLDSNVAVLAALVRDVPLGRVGEAEEVADLVLFLASDESSYCSGSDFMVEGGRTGVVTKPA